MYPAEWINYYLQYFNQWLGAPTNLLLGIARAESGYNPSTGQFQNVCNYLGACGLMQLRPIAAQDLKNQFGITIDRQDALQSVVGAAMLMVLNYKYIRAKGLQPTWESLIVAYNGGWTAGKYYIENGEAPSVEGRNYLASVSNAIFG